MRKFVTAFLVVTLFPLVFSDCSGNEKSKTSRDTSAYQGSSEIPSARQTVTALTVTGMRCGNCVRIIQNAFNGVSGVTNVSVDFRGRGMGVVTVTHDSKITEKEIKRVIVEAGYGIER